MNVLVINCGSSSLKFQLINAETEKVLAKGLCERIGIDGRLTYQPAGGEKEKSDLAMPTHTEAIQFVIDALTNEKTGVVKSLDEIGAVGHRLVHGGEKFASSVVITDEVKKAVEECNDLAPLHNPANLIGVAACEKLMPGTPMVQYLIQLSIRQCRRRLICTVSRMNTMTNTKFVNTASTEPATASFPRKWQNSSENRMIP